MFRPSGTSVCIFFLNMTHRQIFFTMKYDLSSDFCFHEIPLHIWVSVKYYLFFIYCFHEIWPILYIFISTKFDLNVTNFKRLIWFFTCLPLLSSTRSFDQLGADYFTHSVLVGWARKWQPGTTSQICQDVKQTRPSPLPLIQNHINKYKQRTILHITINLCHVCTE